MKEKLIETKLVLDLAEKITKFTNDYVGEFKDTSIENQINRINQAWEIESKIRNVQTYFFNHFIVKTKYDERWQDFIKLKKIEFEDIQQNECFQEFHQQLIDSGLDSLLITAVETNILLMQKAYHDSNEREKGKEK